MKPEKLSIGIDLGTTNSCVAVFEGGDAMTVKDKEGNATTPSYVAFSKNGRLIGKSAKIEALLHTGDVVYNIKRLIGRKYSDPAVQADIKHLPFKVLSDNENILIQIQNENQNKQNYTPEEISAMILLEMKLIVCEEYDLPDTEILDAVITVPAYFKGAQRQATKDAGEIAGLNVLRIINEPTAAAHAYRLDDPSIAETMVLVFDFGGGTLDVTILKIKKGDIMVKATSGDTNLGGLDLDICLREHFLAKHQLPEAIAYRLQASCQMAKHRLSVNSKETFSFLLGDEQTIEMTLTRAEFEKICKKVFDRILVPVQKVLDDAKMVKSQIDDIVLVGGSSQIPKVRRVLSEFFNGKKLNCDINGDEAIARGAAIQAAVINKDPSKVIEGLVMVDVTTHSFGVNSSDKAEMLIPRATVIPTQNSKIFTTPNDNQTSVNIEVYEGEDTEFAKNHCLGSFKLTNIPEAPANVPKINIMFDIDENGIINVTATDEMTGTQNAIRIEKNKWGISEENKQRMKNESANFQKNEMKASREKEVALYKLNNYLERERKGINEEPLKSMVSDSEKRVIGFIIEDTSEWAKKAQTNDYQVAQITQKETEVTSMIYNILEKYLED